MRYGAHKTGCHQILAPPGRPKFGQDQFLLNQSPLTPHYVVVMLRGERLPHTNQWLADVPARCRRPVSLRATTLDRPPQFG